jgi:curved DNA-binding protein
MSAPELTVERARALLGLTPAAAPGDVIGAFRAAVKLTHPDLAGGDAGRFREILGAYRLLQAQPRLPAVIPVATSAILEAHVEIDPRTAIFGGEADATLPGGSRLRIRVPAGARHGERLSAGGERVAVRIRADVDLQVRGSDIWVTAEVAAFLLRDGGRVTLRTPLGPRALWISGKIAERRLARLEGEGLPARGGHPQGSLFIRLTPDTGAPESPARAKLREFAAAWAA